jgi:hypothetical protein
MGGHDVANVYGAKALQMPGGCAWSYDRHGKTEPGSLLSRTGIPVCGADPRGHCRCDVCTAFGGMHLHLHLAAATDGPRRRGLTTDTLHGQLNFTASLINGRYAPGTTLSTLRNKA